jgi:hypothetical protein
MSGCRFTDEWSRLAPLVLAAVRPIGDPRLAPLEPFLGGGTVEQVVRRAQVPRVTAIDPLLHALEQGWLRELDAPDPLRHPLVEDADIGALIDLARSHLREERFADAEELLLRVLQLRPNDPVAARDLELVRQASGSRRPGG